MHSAVTMAALYCVFSSIDGAATSNFAFLTHSFQASNPQSPASSLHSQSNYHSTDEIPFISPYLNKSNFLKSLQFPRATKLDISHPASFSNGTKSPSREFNVSVNNMFTFSSQTVAAPNQPLSIYAYPTFISLLSSSLSTPLTFPPFSIPPPSRMTSTQAQNFTRYAGNKNKSAAEPQLIFTERITKSPIFWKNKRSESVERNRFTRGEPRSHAGNSVAAANNIQSALHEFMQPYIEDDKNVSLKEELTSQNPSFSRNRLDSSTVNRIFCLQQICTRKLGIKGNYSLERNFSKDRMTFPLLRIGPTFNFAQKLPIYPAAKVGVSDNSLHNQTFDSNSTKLALETSVQMEQLVPLATRTLANKELYPQPHSSVPSLKQHPRISHASHRGRERSETEKSVFLEEVFTDRYTEKPDYRTARLFPRNSSTIPNAIDSTKPFKSNESVSGTNKKIEWPDANGQVWNSNIPVSDLHTLQDSVKIPVGIASHLVTSEGMVNNFKSEVLFKRQNVEHGADIKMSSRERRNADSFLDSVHNHAVGVENFNHKQLSRNIPKYLQDNASSAHLTRDGLFIKESDIAAIFRGVAYGGPTEAVAALYHPNAVITPEPVTRIHTTVSDVYGIHRTTSIPSHERLPRLLKESSSETGTKAINRKKVHGMKRKNKLSQGKKKDIARFVIQLPEDTQQPIMDHSNNKFAESKSSEVRNYHKSISESKFGFPTTIQLLIPPTPKIMDTPAPRFTSPPFIPRTSPPSPTHPVTRKSLLKPLLSHSEKMPHLSSIEFPLENSGPSLLSPSVSFSSTDGQLASVGATSTVAILPPGLSNETSSSHGEENPTLSPPQLMDHTPRKLLNLSEIFDNTNATNWYDFDIFNVTGMGDFYDFCRDNVDDIWLVHVYCVTSIFGVISCVCLWRLCCHWRAMPFLLHVSFYLVIFVSSCVRAAMVWWDPFSPDRRGPVEMLNVLSIAGEPSVGVVMSSFIALLLNVFYGMIILPFIIAFFSAAEMTTGIFLEFALKYFRIHTGNLSQSNLNLLSFIVGMVWNVTIFIAYVLLLSCEKFRRSRRRGCKKNYEDIKRSWNYSMLASGCHQISGCCFLVVLAQLSMVALYFYILLHPKDLLSRPERLQYKWALFQIIGRLLEMIVYTSLLVSVGRLAKCYKRRNENIDEDSQCCFTSCCTGREFERHKKRKLGYATDIYMLQIEKESAIRHYPTDDFQLVWSRNSCGKPAENSLSNNSSKTNTTKSSYQRNKTPQKGKKLRSVRERNENISGLYSQNMSPSEEQLLLERQEKSRPNVAEKYKSSGVKKCGDVANLPQSRIEVHRREYRENGGEHRTREKEVHCKRSSSKNSERKAACEKTPVKHRHQEALDETNELFDVKFSLKLNQREASEADDMPAEKEFSRYSILQSHDFYEEETSCDEREGHLRQSSENKSGKLREFCAGRERERFEVSSENAASSKRNHPMPLSDRERAELKKLLAVNLPPADKSMYKYMGVTAARQPHVPTPSPPPAYSDRLKEEEQIRESSEENTETLLPSDENDTPNISEEVEIASACPKRFWSPPTRKRMKFMKNLPPLPVRDGEIINLPSLSPLKPNPSLQRRLESPHHSSPSPTYRQWQDQSYSGEFSVTDCPAYIPRGESVGSFWVRGPSPFADRMLSADLATVSSFSEMRVDYLTDLSSGDGYSLGSISFHRASRMSFSNISDCLNYY